MTIAVVFPGQGAQAAGLGQPWRGHASWSVVERAEAALREPLAHLLLDAPAEDLARTREAQLVVFLTSLVAWEAARPHVGEPVAFAGHSLGQLTALVAAGALSVEDGARLASHRAELTQRSADRNPGRMAALLGATLDQAETACTAAPGACWVANDNAPGQVVIAGTPAGVDAAREAALALGVRRVVALDVGGAFHTPLLAGAAEAFRPVVATTRFANTAIPVVANTDARAYTDGGGWASRLVAHLVQPVRWRQSMLTLADLGATSLIEVGPGTTLTGLAARAVPELDRRNCAVPADIPRPLEVH